MAEVGVQDPARARAFFTPSSEPSLEREEDGWAARPEISGKRGAFGAFRGTAKCKETKRLGVKKLVLGEATDAETAKVDDVLRDERDAASRAAAPEIADPRAAAEHPNGLPWLRFTTE